MSSAATLDHSSSLPAASSRSSPAERPIKLLVVGASQGTGALVVAQALGRGHAVSAFSRSPHKDPLEHPRVRKIAGSFHDAQAVHDAVAGHDAVVITAAATSMRAFRDNPSYFSDGTAHVIDAMKQHGVSRLVMLSALGVGESRPLLPFLARKLLADLLLALPYADHERQERLVRESGLDWVVARPGRLTNGAAKLSYRRAEGLERVPATISRADVADFLVEAAATPSWVGKAVQLGG